MSIKRVETQKTPDGRYIYQIGEVDDVGGGFGCFFIEKSSGDVVHYDADGNRVYRASRAVRTEYEGDFFATREEAMTAGRAAI